MIDKKTIRKIKTYIERNSKVMKNIFIWGLVGFLTYTILLSRFEEKTYEDKKQTQFNLIEIIKQPEKIKNIIIKENDNKNYNLIVTFKDNNKTIESKELDIMSIKWNYEKLFIEKQIPYEIEYKLEKPNLLLVIIGLLLKFGLPVGMVYLLYTSLKAQGLFGTKDKYEILKPEDIKGDLKDLVGMQDIKTELLQIKDLYNNRHKYKSFGINSAFNIMFSGPAGTGKTKIAGFLAKELNLPIIFASGSNLESGFVGGGSKTIKEIHEKAQEYEKVIVFLDEAQELFTKRGSSNMKFADDTANTFLSILDGIKTEKDSEIIWIVASNFDDNNMQMDEAMLRRFQVKVNFRLPNKDERKGIIEMYMGKIDSSNIEELNYEYCADITSNLSPAIIENIVKECGKMAIRENVKITTDLFFKAFERTTIGLTDRETTKNLEKQRKVIGIHELGHFITSYSLLKEKYNNDYELIKENTPLLKISTESVSKYNALGYVLNKQDEISLKTTEELEGEIISLYGGVAAEYVFVGNNHSLITTGSSNDIEKVSKMLNLMFNKLNMYSKVKINTDIAKNDILKKLTEEEMIKKSEELYNKSIKIVAENKELIEMILPILLEKFVLSVDEMFNLIKNYENGNTSNKHSNDN